ncbi:MAG: hypothetical protein JXD23_13390 [Spirochaetales bacterium]|nr:hypothetical protein [Spirochaetales bacterium]
MKPQKRIAYILGIVFFLQAMAAGAQEEQQVDLRALRSAGALNTVIVKPDAAPTSAPNTASIKLPTGSFVAWKLRSAPVQSVQADGTVNVKLPIGIQPVLKDNRRLTLQPDVEIPGGGYNFESSAVGYTASLQIAVLVEAGASGDAVVALPQPVRFHITPAAGFAEPSDVVIDRTFSYRTVRLSARNPDSPVLVTILPSFLNEHIPLDIPVNRSKIMIEANPKRIYGWGLQTTTLSVAVPDLAAGGNNTVLLHASGGILGADTRVTLDENGYGTHPLRSFNLGETTVTVSYPAAGLTASTSVFFEFPLRFIVFAIVGGIFGAVAKILMSRDEIMKRKNPPAAVVCRICLGIILGFMAAAAYTVGVNLTGVNFSADLSGVEEILTLVIAMIVGFLGNLPGLAKAKDDTKPSP